MSNTSEYFEPEPLGWLMLEPTESLIEELARRHPNGCLIALEAENDADGDYFEMVAGDPNICSKLALVLQWNLYRMWDEVN